MTDTSAEAVEALAKRLKRDLDWRPGSLCERAAATLRALLAERDLLRAAWLRAIQAENACVITGDPCGAKRCGCAAEQEVLIRGADNDA